MWRWLLVESNAIQPAEQFWLRPGAREVSKSNPEPVPTACPLVRPQASSLRPVVAFRQRRSSYVLAERSAQSKPVVMIQAAWGFLRPSSRVVQRSAGTARYVRSVSFPPNQDSLANREHGPGVVPVLVRMPCWPRAGSQARSDSMSRSGRR